jgi:hypothetical protein
MMLMPVRRRRFRLQKCFVFASQDAKFYVDMVDAEDVENGRWLRGYSGSESSNVAVISDRILLRSGSGGEGALE